MNIQELDAYDVHESELYTSMSTWHVATLCLRDSPTQAHPLSPTDPVDTTRPQSLPIILEYLFAIWMITMLPHR